MKRKAALAAVLSALSLCACQSGPKEEVYSRPMEEFAHGELTAAYVNYGNTNFGYDAMLTEVSSTYRNLTITPQVYATSDEFVTDVTTQLNAGGGPDLFLLDLAAPLSFQKMARNGTYADLTPYLEADSRYNADDYYGIDACQVNGGQYALPLSIASFALYMTSDQIFQLRLDGVDFQTVDGLLYVLNAAHSYYERDIFYPAIFPQVVRTDFASMWLDAFGIQVVDFDSKEVVLEKEFYHQIADMVRDHIGGLEEHLGREMEVLHDTYGFQNTRLVLTDTDRSLIRYYHFYSAASALDLGSHRYPFVSYQDESRIAGQIEYYAAVNQNSENKLLAYETARILMDYPYTGMTTANIFPSACPVNKSTYQQYAMTVNRWAGYYTLDDNTVTVREDVRTRDELINDTPDLHMTDSDALRIVAEAMDDYIRGSTDDFDACWENLINRLTLYLTE